MQITVGELIQALQDNCTSIYQKVVVSNRNNYEFLIDGFGESDNGELVIDIIEVKKQKVRYK
jgi:hypothetical protein